ncbi:MAG: metallophosphoesterase [bacterium]|nr:metallophosphoesterase [bacterium]
MRLLALTDIHSERKVIAKLQRILEEKWDWVLIAGDLTNSGDVHFVEDLLEIVPAQTLTIHGNMDTIEVMKLLEDKGISIHNKRKEIGEYNVVGIGGSNITPFHTPTEYPEDKIESGLDRLQIDSQTILLSHAPPFNSGLDTVGGGISAGSHAIRKIIEAKQPCLNICGHIHEQEGKAMLGKTLVVKLAPALRGRAAEINILDEITVRFFDL